MLSPLMQAVAVCLADYSASSVTSRCQLTRRLAAHSVGDMTFPSTLLRTEYAGLHPQFTVASPRLSAMWVFYFLLMIPVVAAVPALELCLEIKLNFMPCDIRSPSKSKSSTEYCRTSTEQAGRQL